MWKQFPRLTAIFVLTALVWGLGALSTMASHRCVTPEPPQPALAHIPSFGDGPKITTNAAVPEEDKLAIARLLKKPPATRDEIRALVKELWPKLSPMARNITQEWVASKLINLPKDGVREALERVKASGRSIKEKDFYEAIYKIKVPLVVKQLTGRVVFMYVPNCLFAVYMALQKIEGLAVEQERLMFREKLLKEVEEPITTICKPGSMLHLVLRQRGGARTKQVRTTPPPQKKAKQSSEEEEEEEWIPVMPDHQYIQEWCEKDHDKGKELVAPNFNTLL